MVESELETKAIDQDAVLLRSPENIRSALSALGDNPSKESFNAILSLVEVVAAQYSNIAEDYSIKKEQNNNMQKLLNGLRAKQGHYDLIFKALRDNYSELKSATEEEFLENLVNFIEDTQVRKKELEKETLTDKLTQAHNLTYFEKSMEDEMKQANKKKKGLTNLSLGYIDVDYFKDVNDESIGGHHLTGDVILKQTTQFFVENLPDSYEVCRIGGDEFGIIAPENINFVSKERGSYDKLETLRKKVRDHKFKDENDEKYPKTITISIGIADYRKGENMREIRTKADSALYKAKKDGRNQTVIFGQKNRALARDFIKPPSTLKRISYGLKYIITGKW